MSDNEEEEEDGEEGIEGAGGRGGRGGGGNGVYDESGSEADSEENGRRGVGRPARMKRSGSYSSTTSVVDSQGSFDEPNDGTVVYKKWGRGFKKVLSGISDPKISEDGKRCVAALLHHYCHTLHHNMLSVFFIVLIHSICIRLE